MISNKMLEDMRRKKMESLRKQGWNEKQVQAWARGWDSVDKMRRAK